MDLFEVTEKDTLLEDTNAPVDDGEARTSPNDVPSTIEALSNSRRRKIRRRHRTSLLGDVFHAVVLFTMI